MMSSTQSLEGRLGVDGGSIQDARHRSAIQSVAHELGLPLETVAANYALLLSELSERARVADFLPLLIVKRLRKIFRASR